MAVGKVLLSVLTLSILLSRGSAIVPLFGWSNSDAFSGVKADQFSSANELIYDAALDNIDVIVIFKSPVLSFDSLAKYGGLYGGKNPALSSLQAEMKSSKSSVLAGVDGNVASDLISTLSFVTEQQPQILSSAEGLTQHKLIQVELLTASDTESALSEQDDIIADVMNAVKALPSSPSYAAIFTSSHTHMSRANSERNELRRSVDEGVYRVAREEGDSEGTGPLCYTTTTNGTNPGSEDLCMAFCFTEQLIVRRNASADRKSREDEGQVGDRLENIQIIGGSCSNDTEYCSDYSAACIRFTATVNGSTSNDVVNFTFLFPKGHCTGDLPRGDPNVTCGFWSMELLVDEEQFQRGGEERKIFSAFTIPLGTSYACGENRLNEFSPFNTTESGNGGDGYSYQFMGIQVQMYDGISYNKQGAPVFASAYNCQGYISHIPFMGLIATIILILILYCSVAFVFSIQTMDRFDDPRGPTISVENLH